jgi:hypothetical protein
MRDARRGEDSYCQSRTPRDLVKDRDSHRPGAPSIDECQLRPTLSRGASSLARHRSSGLRRPGLASDALSRGQSLHRWSCRARRVRFRAFITRARFVPHAARRPLPSTTIRKHDPRTSSTSMLIANLAPCGVQLAIECARDSRSPNYISSLSFARAQPSSSRVRGLRAGASRLCWHLPPRWLAVEALPQPNDRLGHLLSPTLSTPRLESPRWAKSRPMNV